MIIHVRLSDNIRHIKVKGETVTYCGIDYGALQNPRNELGYAASPVHEKHDCEECHIAWHAKNDKETK